VRARAKARPETGDGGWGAYLLALVVVWGALAAGGFVYAQQKHFSQSLLWAVLPAFCAEAALYLIPGFAAPRRAFTSFGSAGARAGFLTMAAAAPYVVLTARVGGFRLPEFALLLLLAALLSFWYAATRPNALSDLLFLAVAAAVYLTHVFAQIYPHPAPHLPLDILGRLMWIHTGILAVLGVRGWEARIGFLPGAEDWRVGLEHFVVFLIPAGALVWTLHLLHFGMRGPWYRVPLTALGVFFGFLWTVALAEEFFFRGFLQALLARAWNSNFAALVAASVIFGACHLPFRGFPNYRWSALATLLGLACGAGWWRTGSIRAPMVTHALVVATWRTFFTG
jgi:membrane protease YdiL (CAAX protease family)